MCSLGGPNTPALPCTTGFKSSQNLLRSWSLAPSGTAALAAETSSSRRRPCKGEHMVAICGDRTFRYRESRHAVHVTAGGRERVVITAMICIGRERSYPNSDMHCSSTEITVTHQAACMESKQGWFAFAQRIETALQLNLAPYLQAPNLFQNPNHGLDERCL